MSVTRHPSARVLQEYASGALRPAFAVVAAAHLETCGECRRSVAEVEEAAGRDLLRSEPAPLGEHAWPHLRARLDRAFIADASIEGHSVVDRIAFGRKRWAAPDLWLRHAPSDVRGEDLLFLLRAPANLAVPHGHRGREFTAILQGSFREGDRHYAAGDFCEMSDVSKHRPVAGSPDGCVCLIASEHPMRMHSWFGRAAQMLTGA